MFAQTHQDPLERDADDVCGLCKHLRDVCKFCFGEEFEEIRTIQKDEGLLDVYDLVGD